MSRQAGLLIDRNGSVQCVIVGEPEEITIPVLDRFQLVPSRLRKLRFVRTSLSSAEIDNDDIADLALLRLDSLSVLTGTEAGDLRTLRTVHLMPPSAMPGDDFIPHAVIGHIDPHRKPFEYTHFIYSLEDEISAKTKSLYRSEKGRSAILAGVFSSREVMTEHIAELTELASSDGIDIVDTIVQIRPSPHPRTVMGGGKLTEVMIKAMVKGCDTVIFDNNLSPSQLKAIASMSDLRIMDRTQLILEIFASRATTGEGKIRVELAQLRHFLPYLTGRHDSLSRITGGKAVKGPGETKLEMERRHIQDRINILSAKLKNIERNRSVQRGRRKRNDVPVVSIIGYTNAGKSTLLNTLTQSDVYADDRMFATLDTSSKRIRFPQEKEIVITDTVGFIRDLPEGLMGAFKSTLEELHEADLLLHVVDATSPYAAEHIKSVRRILNELEIDKPEILVFNKVDMLDEFFMQMFAADYPDAIFIAAKDRKTLAPLIEKINPSAGYYFADNVAE